MRLVAFFLLICVSTWVHAGCKLALTSSPAGFVDAGSTVNFDFTSTDDGGGGCTGSSGFNIVPISDTTRPPGSGSMLTTSPTGTVTVGGNVAPTPSVSIASRGGGQVVFQVFCTSNCTNTNTAQFSLIISVADVISISTVAGTSGVTPTNQPFPELKVQVMKNGVADGTADVHWTIVGPNAKFPDGSSDTVTSAASASPAGTHSIIVTAGATPASGINVRAVPRYSGVDCCGGDVVADFYLTSTNNFELVPITSTSQTAPPNSARALTVRLNRDGSPYGNSSSGNVGVRWTLVSGPDSAAIPNSMIPAGTDASGLATVSFSGAQEGSYLVRATAENIPKRKASSGSLPITLDFNITVQTNRGLEIVAGNNASGGPGAQASLTVRALDNALPARGVDIDWSVLASSQGSATLASARTTSSSVTPLGETTNTVTFGANAGPITIRAARVDDPSVFVDFAVQSTGTQRALQIVSGNNATGSSGSQVSLVVRALDNDTAVAGKTINWSIRSGATSASLAAAATQTSATTPLGETSNSLTFTSTPGAIVVRASRAEDPNVFVDFALENFAFRLERVQPASGSASALTGTEVGFQVRVLRTGTTSSPLVGTTVNWTQSGPAAGVFELPGGTTPANASPTDVNGIAAIDFSSSQPGNYTITASVTPPSGSPLSTTFDLSLTGLYELTVVTPASRAVSTRIGQPTPLKVRLRRDGRALSGETITWSAPSGALSSSSVSTDVNGEASVQFSPSQAGPVTVTATAANPSQNVLGPAPVSETIIVTGLVGNLALLSQPSGAFSDEETSSGLEVQVGKFDGSALTGIDGLRVDFQILQGAATFVGGGSSASTTSASGGRASSPRLAIGRSAQPLVIRVSSANGGSADFTIPVTPSQYSLQLSPGVTLPLMLREEETLPLRVIVMRRGSGASVPLAGASVVWLPSAGAQVNPTTSSTDAGGTASTVFSAATSGDYSVRAQFDPGVTAPVSLDQAVRVNPSLRTLEPVSGGNQSDRAGNTLRLPLVVLAKTNGMPRSGVAIQWSVSPANAAQIIPASSNTGPDGSSSVQVAFAQTAAPGTVTVVASRSDAPSATAAFVLTVQAEPTSTLAIRSSQGDGQIGLVGRRGEPLAVTLTRDGQPSVGSTVNWRIVSGSATLDNANTTTDNNGIARNGFVFGATAGTVEIEASSGDVAARFQVSSREPELSLVSGNNQAGMPGDTLAADFIVQASIGGNTVAEGLAVSWSVESGGGTINPATSTTDSSGRARSRLTLGPNPAINTVRARLSNGASVLFTAAAARPSLRPVSGDNQQGLASSRANAPLVVQLLDGSGAPLVGQTIRWNVLSGSAQLDDSSSRTGSNGQASIGFSFGSTPGPIVITASSDLVSNRIDFNAVATQPQVDAVRGNTQTGGAGQELADDLVVRIGGPGRKTLEGIAVSWRVTAGGGRLRNDVSLTDANGEARNRWTLGFASVQQRVVATLPGGREFVFAATAEGAGGTLRIVSGDQQTVPPNTDSQPLVVELVDGLGRPLPGFEVRWTGENATFAETVTTTGSNGRTQNVARVPNPGPATVRAQAIGLENVAISFRLNGAIASLPNLPPRQQPVGNAIDNLCPALAALTNRTPEEEDLYQRCLELAQNAGDNPDDVQNALQQLPSDVSTNLSNSGLDSVDGQFNNLSTRFDMLRNGQTGGSNNQFQIGLWTPTGMLPLSFLPSILANSAGEDEPTEEIGTDFSRWGFFATGTIGRGKIEQGTNTPKSEYDVAGLTAGVDYRFSDHVIGGVALGYTQNNNDLANDRGSLDTRGWAVSGYATWFSDRMWYVDGVLSYGRNQYELERRIDYTIRARDGGRTTIEQVASADTDGTQSGLSLSVGRDWQKGAWSLSGYLKGNLAKVEFNPYQERMIEGRPGRGLALRVDAREVKSRSTVLGGKATYVMSRDWGILMPTATLEWVHEYEDDPAQLSARFLFDPSGSPIEQFGDAKDSNYYNAGVGLSALFPGGRSAYLYYEQLVGAARLRQGILSLGVRIEF